MRVLTVNFDPENSQLHEVRVPCDSQIFFQSESLINVRFELKIFAIDFNLILNVKKYVSFVLTDFQLIQVAA